jgi:hypothetical protein
MASSRRVGVSLPNKSKAKNFLRRTVTVDRQLVSTSGQAPAFGPPRTESFMRTIPPQVVTEALAAHIAAFPPGPDGLVFSNANGHKIRGNAFSTMWSKAAKAVGTTATPTR